MTADSELGREPVRPAVLLCWGYHRPGWNEIFEQLKADFQFHYLFFFSPRLARGRVPEAPIHFWTDFCSPYEVIEQIRPTMIVFMGLDGLQTVALNLAARVARVPTLYLQHGVMLPLSESTAIKSTSKDSDKFFCLTKREKLHQVTFFLRALRAENLMALFFAIRWMMMRFKHGEQTALALNKSEHRRADLYAVYTRGGAEPLLRERDGVPSDRIVEIGHPGFDEFFVQTSQTDTDEIFELLIDQPISGAPEIPVALKSTEEVLEFHQRLAEFCAARGAHLIVKLHPYSDGTTPRLQSDKITYVKDVDSMPKLIHQSRAVYGFYSALLLPVLCLKPCCLFDLGFENTLQQTAQRLGVAELVGFESLPPMDFHLRIKPAEGLSEFIRSQLFQADGQSLRRLRKLLVDLSQERRI